MNYTSRTARLITSFFATTYAILTIRFHDWAQQFVLSVQKDPAWTWPALAGIVIILFSLAAFFVRQWPRHHVPGRNRLLLVSWLVTFVLVGSAQWLLVSVHTEAIHYLQYGILTALVFSIVRRIPSTLIIVIIVGMLDEAYQYWFLYPGWPVYYDINDVILNALAAGLMLLFLASAVPQMFASEEHDPWFLRNIDLIMLASISLLLVGGIATDLIALYRFPAENSQDALLIMNRGGASSRFWAHAWWSGRYYHQLSLANGMIAVVFIGHYYRYSLPLLVSRKPI